MLTNSHSASILEILSVEAKEGKTDKGAVYTIFTMPSVIHCDTGETKVGNVKMIRTSNNAENFVIPSSGKFYPVYEPRPHWKSGECLPELISLVPVAVAGAVPVRPAPAASVPPVVPKS
jgi:hypothetical protein